MIVEEELRSDTVDYRRKLSDRFMHDLKCGILEPLLGRIQRDDTLMLALRGKYINIYYRGGSLFKISELSTRCPGSQSTYSVEFDNNYYSGFQSLPVYFPSLVSDNRHTMALIGAIPILKYVMDSFLATHNKPEKEFQQLVVRENNSSPIANETEYFIVDIELAGVLPRARFDMLAVRWLSSERARPGRLVPVLIEMKYGIDALQGKAGIIKHLNDAYLLRKDKDCWDNLRTGLQKHLKQLKDLGLLKFNTSLAVPDLLLHPTKTPELIFILANYNPRSQIALDILPEFNAVLEGLDPQNSPEKLLEVRFFQASSAGYGMHHVSMLTTADFEARIKELYKASKPMIPMPVVIAT